MEEFCFQGFSQSKIRLRKVTGILSYIFLFTWAPTGSTRMQVIEKSKRKKKSLWSLSCRVALKSDWEHVANMSLTTFFEGNMASPSPLSKANTSFSLALFRELGDNDRTANLFYSPFSISSALAMVLLGAGGNTATEMSKVGRATSASVWKSSEQQHRLSHPVWLEPGWKLRQFYHTLGHHTCVAEAELGVFWLRCGYLHICDNMSSETGKALLSAHCLSSSRLQQGASPRSWPVRIPHLTGFNRGELSMKCSSWSGCVTVAVIVAVRYHKEMRRWINSWTSQFIQLLLTVANLTDFQWPKFVGCLMT